MKPVFCMILGILALWGCQSLKAPEETLVREGRGRGYRGPIRVLVETEDGLILNVEILEHQEDEFVGGEAIEQLLSQALESGSAELDAISGATESSRGFLEALENALGMR